ncbi:MAG: hypothetical protein PUK56_03300, partial [Fusobacteriaceae bacterium]|nr:hypothetical protein [Fusobacterium sp.]MDD7410240.1 hypothetical protein [Fusobacteriaceae bacterium]MDY5712540.1 hypothetical protein [Fusobacterium gastrosuis]
NIIVFDREFLATARKDELIERIAHEFGHYTEADNETKSQKAAEYFSELVMEKVKGVSSKEATDETYARIRNNNNLIIGEEGKKLADNIPMNDREYKGYGISKGASFMTPKGGAGFELLHTIVIDDNTGETYLAHVLGMSAGVASKFSAEIGGKFQYFPNINKPEDLDGGLSVSGNVDLSSIIPVNATIGGSYDLVNKNLESINGGISYNSKTIDNIIENNSSLKKLEFKVFNFNMSAEANSSLLLAKEKISIKESEELFNLRKRELEIEEQLKAKNINSDLKENLETERKIINQKTEKLVQKIYEKRKVKVIHGDPDTWD